jgi:hypothetical protein
MKAGGDAIKMQTPPRYILDQIVVDQHILRKASDVHPVPKPRKPAVMQMVADYFPIGGKRVIFATAGYAIAGGVADGVVDNANETSGDDVYPASRLVAQAVKYHPLELYVMGVGDKRAADPCCSLAQRHSCRLSRWPL